MAEEKPEDKINIHTAIMSDIYLREVKKLVDFIKSLPAWTIDLMEIKSPRCGYTTVKLEATLDWAGNIKDDTDNSGEPEEE